MVEVCRKIRICEGPSTNEGNEDTTEEPNVQRRVSEVDFVTFFGLISILYFLFLH